MNTVMLSAVVAAIVAPYAVIFVGFYRCEPLRADLSARRRKRTRDNATARMS